MPDVLRSTIRLADRDRDPGGVLSSHDDALRTDRLTRAVVAATGSPG